VCCRLDQEGEVAAVRHNHTALDSFCNIPLDKVKPWYEGFMLLSEIMVEPENLGQFRLTEGCLFFIFLQ
jgi:hypothetical protein